MKKIILIILLIAALLFGGMQLMVYNTKKHSPEKTEFFSQNDTEIEIVYSSPFKKDRKIIGALVPYGKVWRTGANEATTFKTNKDITIQNQILKAGEYTLWTIPGENEWEIIFNSKEYGWGVNWSEEAQREAEFDVVNVKVPVQQMTETQESFEIKIDENTNLCLSWENTKVCVPMEI